MKIVEQFVQSKTGNEAECEDSIFVSNDYAAVIDGATSKSSYRYHNRLSGRASSLILTHVLKKIDAEASAEDAILFLTKSIYELYLSNNVLEQVKSNPIHRASASIVVYSKFRNEIWMVGDCQCMVDGNKYSNKKQIDELLSNVRSFYLQTEDELGRLNIKEDKGREFILPLLERQALFQNTGLDSEYSYGVIDGFEVPKEEIRVIKFSTKPKNLILASDGYPVLYSTLKQSENKLRELIDVDPLCYKEFKSTKGLQEGNISFDDRAYLRLKID